MSTLRKARSKKSRNDRSANAATSSPRAPVNQPSRPRRWPVWLLAAVCLVVAAGATYYLVDFVLWPRIPVALVGTWQSKDSQQNVVTLEFWANGHFEARAEVGGQVGVVYGSAVTDPNDDTKLLITSTDRKSGHQITKTHIIHSLTEKELMLEDPMGKVSRLVRLE